MIEPKWEKTKKSLIPYCLWLKEKGVVKQETEEKREDERADLQWPITILADYASVEGTTVNISIDGIYIRCEEPLLLNESYRMSIQPPNHDAIEVLGKVVRSEFYGMSEDNSTYSMGVCVVEVSDQERDALSNLIDPSEL